MKNGIWRLDIKVHISSKILRTFFLKRFKKFRIFKRSHIFSMFEFTFFNIIPTELLAKCVLDFFL